MIGKQVKQLTPVEAPTAQRLMQTPSCKTHKFQKLETYPSMRHSMDRCDHAKTAKLMFNGTNKFDYKLNLGAKTQTAVLHATQLKRDNRDNRDYGQYSKPTNRRPELVKDMQKSLGRNLDRPRQVKRNPASYLCDDLEDVATGRVFDMEQDNLVDAWKRIPRQHTLSFYGISSQKNQPEAIAFNRLVSTCLQRAAQPEQPKRSRYRVKAKRKSAKILGNLVPNLDELATTNAGKTLRNKKPNKTSTKATAKTNPSALRVALDMAKPINQVKTDLRRIYMNCYHAYCTPNKSADLEWGKDLNQYTDEARIAEAEQLDKRLEKPLARTVKDKKKRMHAGVVGKSYAGNDDDSRYVSVQLEKTEHEAEAAGDNAKRRRNVDKLVIKRELIFPEPIPKLQPSKPQAEKGNPNHNNCICDNCFHCQSDYYDCLSATSESV